MVNVRPITRADFDQWKPLWDGYNAFYGRLDETALPAEITHKTWNRFLDPGEPINALVAETDGQLLGLVHYIFHRSTTLMEPTCYLQDLFTKDTERGKGIGRALIEAVYEKAQAAGTRGCTGTPTDQTPQDATYMTKWPNTADFWSTRGPSSHNGVEEP